MCVNDILCTYASPCIVSLHVPSRYGLWVEQTVIKIPSKLYNKRTRDHPPVGGGRGVDNSDVSVDASYINNDGFKLFISHVKQLIVSWLYRMCIVYGLCSQSFSENDDFHSFSISSKLYWGWWWSLGQLSWYVSPCMFMTITNICAYLVNI